MTLEIDPKYLFHKCEEVTEFSTVPEFVSKMFEFAYANKGVGLAANQVGDNRRIIIVNTGHVKEAMINPVITKRFDSVKSVEGCLSFPKGLVKVERSKQITVKWTSPEGYPQQRKYRGLEACVIQHEIDHLDGETIFSPFIVLQKGEPRK